MLKYAPPPAYFSWFRLVASKTRISNAVSYFEGSWEVSMASQHGAGTGEKDMEKYRVKRAKESFQFHGSKT